MKRLLLFFLLSIVFILMSGCNNNAGIIKWTFSNDLLDWKDVKGAEYYQLSFYDENHELKPMNDYYSTYAYASEYWFGFAANETDFYLKIIVFYNDGSHEVSDFIDFTIQREFNGPGYLAGDYVYDNLMWTGVGLGEDGFVDYTLSINDQEYTVTDANEFEISNFEDGLYEAKVRANYENGSSEWSLSYFFLLGKEKYSTSASYDVTSKEDFTYTFPEGSIETVRGYYNFHSLWNLPDYIVSLDGSTITVNYHYILNMADGEYADGSEMGILISLQIISEDWLYSLFIINYEIE